MISLRDLEVDLGEFILKDVDLDIDDGEYFILLGPTGAGKTVLLEAIAGLHPLRKGTISVNDKEITRLTPEKRGVSIVYQDQMLFPHMSVEKNIAFGLRAAKCPKQDIRQRVDDITKLLRITHLARRRPTTLSGGEKQKVALARALVTKPAVLLLDEPLSALDPQTREAMQQELAEIHRRLKVTFVHVTHDFEEAVALGDRVAVLNQGQIAQVGTPQDVLRRPASAFVAEFALSRNVFKADARHVDEGYASADIGGLELMVATHIRGPVHLTVRPEDILLSLEPLHSSARNAFEGTISQILERGSVLYVTVTVPPEFVCLITSQAREELGLKEGVRVWLHFKATAIHAF
ncbi:MAG: ABC transporter ATP-binding protein [Thermoleophilia bacterium]|nr:ABC transporter ATP-binding protein [Thermoleophilia bacterium]